MEFVCFKWRAPLGYRSSYGPQQPNTLWSMLARNYEGPCRLTCITDDPVGISSEIRVIPMWEFGGDIPSPHGQGNPSCYRRLPLWGELGAQLIGPRFATLDMDIVIVDRINPIFDVEDDFRIWGDTAKGTPYNGSITLQTAGARRQVWDDFCPIESPKKGRALGYIGSDQAWIAARLGPHEKKWTKRDGIYSYRNEVAKNGGQLPAGARIVVFHGFYDPWHPTMRAKHPWVRRHYR
jgi:hypothetical protein